MNDNRKRTRTTIYTIQFIKQCDIQMVWEFRYLSRLKTTLNSTQGTHLYILCLLQEEHIKQISHTTFRPKSMKVTVTSATN